MKTTDAPDRLATLRRWTSKAALAGAAAFAGTFLFLSAFVCALLGVQQLQQPAFFGLAGPPLALELLRPVVVISGTMAVITVAIYGLSVLRAEQTPVPQPQPW